MTISCALLVMSVAAATPDPTVTLSIAPLWPAVDNLAEHADDHFFQLPLVLEVTSVDGAGYIFELTPTAHSFLEDDESPGPGLGESLRLIASAGRIKRLHGPNTNGPFTVFKLLAVAGVDGQNRTVLSPLLRVQAAGSLSVGMDIGYSFFFDGVSLSLVIGASLGVGFNVPYGGGLPFSTAIPSFLVGVTNGGAVMPVVDPNLNVLRVGIVL